MRILHFENMESVNKRKKNLYKALRKNEKPANTLEI